MKNFMEKIMEKVGNKFFRFMTVLSVVLVLTVAGNSDKFPFVLWIAMMATSMLITYIFAKHSFSAEELKQIEKEDI